MPELRGGMRLRHPTARNVRYTVQVLKPYPVPYQCPPPRLGGCGMAHQFKTYHLDLDDTGTVIVNTVLYERIASRLAVDGFVVVEHVEKPPPQLIGAAGALPRVDLSRPVTEGVTR